MEKNNIYINGKIRTITIREDKNYNTITYCINGKYLKNEIAWRYLEEFQKYPAFKMEKSTRNNVIIRSYQLIEE